MRHLAALLALVLALSACGGACRRSGPPLPGSAAPVAAPADTEAAGIRFIERVTGGARASDPLPLIVGIHGRGGSPERFGRALSSLSVRARVILPYGPDPVGQGFSWFANWNNDAEMADSTRRAADRVAAMIDEIVRRRPTVGKPIVTGFSQGGILSFTLAALHPEALRATFPMGGLLAPALVPGAWPQGIEMPRLHAFHGADDDVVPAGGARASVRRLVALGLPAELTEYPGVGHDISAEMRRDLVKAIEATLSP